jgi:hypothetical protein
MPKSAVQFGSAEYHDKVARGVHPPAMFATAPEIINTHELEDTYSTVDELLEAKQEEADARPGVGYDIPEGFTKEPEDTRQSGWFGGLTQRIKSNGYDWSKPVETEVTSTSYPVPGSGAMVINGHHRLAVMHRDRPEEFLPLDTTF